jgi:hypothetical protein
MRGSHFILKELQRITENRYLAFSHFFLTFFSLSRFNLAGYMNERTGNSSRREAQDPK